MSEWRAYTAEEICGMDGKELDALWAGIQRECEKLGIPLGEGSEEYWSDRGVLDLQRAIMLTRVQKGTEMAVKAFMDSVL